MTKEAKIYQSIIKECEAIDKDNAHLFATKLSRLVCIGLLTRQQREIFNTLTITGVTTSEITSLTSYSSKNVSSVLAYLESKLSFVYSKLDDKGNRVWFTTIEII